MKRMVSFFLAVVFMFSMTIGCVAEIEKVKAAEELEKYGIVSRNALHALTVDGPVTRAGMTKMVIGMMGRAPKETSTGFTDVPADHGASGYIALAADLGIVNGMGDGTFWPEEFITYPQAIKMVVCALGYGAEAESRGGYPHGYIMIGTKLGIIPTNITTAAFADRGEIMLLLAKALDVPIMVMESGVDAVIYKVLDGKNGERFETLRTRLEKA